MEAKYRLDIGVKRGNSSFIFDLDDIINENIHLSIEYIAIACKKAIKEGNFSYGYDLIKMAKKLKGYDNSLLFQIEGDLRIKESLELIENNKNGNIVDIYKIKEKCFSTINFIRGNYDVTIEKTLIEDLKKLEEYNSLININKYLVEIDSHIYINNLNLMDFILLSSLALESEKFNVDKVKVGKLLYSYGEELNNYIGEILSDSDRARENRIKRLFFEYREASFIDSEEFKDIIENFPLNYGDLLDLEGKCYSLYSFNKSKMIREKISILCRFNIVEYNSLPNIYKEYVVRKINEYYGSVVRLDLLYKYMDEIIKYVLENKNKNSILIP